MSLSVLPICHTKDTAVIWIDSLAVISAFIADCINVLIHFAGFLHHIIVTWHHIVMCHCEVKGCFTVIPMFTTVSNTTGTWHRSWCFAIRLQHKCAAKIHRNSENSSNDVNSDLLTVPAHWTTLNAALKNGKRAKIQQKNISLKVTQMCAVAESNETDHTNLLYHSTSLLADSCMVMSPSLAIAYGNDKRVRWNEAICNKWQQQHQD